MVLGEFKNAEMEEAEAHRTLLSLINLYSNRGGMPFSKVDYEFRSTCGFHIPYKSFGADNLRSWILTLPDIYLIHDNYGNEVLIQQSKKSSRIKDLIMKQRSSQKVSATKINNNNRKYSHQNKYRTNGNTSIPEDSFIHSSMNNDWLKESDTFEFFNKLEAMLPLVYNHQALGDDFFLDIADTKLGYHVPNKGIRECGLCTSGQTIATLMERVKNAEILAPRVVVLIGFQDLLSGQNVNNMIYDLRQLVFELKQKNTCVTLITIPPSPKMPSSKKLNSRLNVYNQAIMDYSCSTDLQCNAIDMHTIFLKEQATFHRDFNRFVKVAKNDTYQVFSDYGRKVFLNTLRVCLKEQLEDGQ